MKEPKIRNLKKHKDIKTRIPIISKNKENIDNVYRKKRMSICKSQSLSQSQYNPVIVPS